MRPLLVGITLVLAAAHAHADDCGRDAAELRGVLEREARDAERWNAAWQITFGTAAAAQVGFAVAGSNPLGPFDRDYEETLWVGAGKATLGFLARTVMPLRVEVPTSSGDVCADRLALGHALVDAARRERRLFWMNHVGGLAVNAAGVVILGTRRSWSLGALSFAIGYPVGLLSNYTMPRRSWHYLRDTTWTVQRDATSWTIGVAGSF